MNTIRILFDEDVIVVGMEREVQYFVTIDCIRASTCRANICFQMIVLYGCSFVNDYDIDTLRKNCLTSVFRACYNHFWTRNNTDPILEPGYEVHFKDNIWSYIVRYIVVGLYLLPDRLAAQQSRHFLKAVLVEVPRNVRANLNATNPLQ